MQAEILAPESEDFRSEQAEITPNALAILNQSEHAAMVSTANLPSNRRKLKDFDDKLMAYANHSQPVALNVILLKAEDFPPSAAGQQGNPHGRADLFAGVVGQGDIVAGFELEEAAGAVEVRAGGQVPSGAGGERAGGRDGAEIRNGGEEVGGAGGRREQIRRRGVRESCVPCYVER